MPVLLSSALHDQLLAEAASAHPFECCGLLLGDAEAITHIRPCTNVADDPSDTFEIDPAALIAAERAMRSGGPRIIGYYHSHPNGRAEPSPRDAASAAPDGRLWLIIAGTAITAWRAAAGGSVHAAFDAEEIAPPAP